MKALIFFGIGGPLAWLSVCLAWTLFVYAYQMHYAVN